MATITRCILQIVDPTARVEIQPSVAKEETKILQIDGSTYTIHDAIEKTHITDLVNQINRLVKRDMRHSHPTDSTPTTGAVYTVEAEETVIGCYDKKADADKVAALAREIFILIPQDVVVENSTVMYKQVKYDTSFEDVAAVVSVFLQVQPPQVVVME